MALLSRYYIKKIKKNEVEAIKRHRNNEYTDTEITIIRPICTPEVFKYYYFYCPNDNTWNDLAKKLLPEEKIIHILTVTIQKGFSHLYHPACLFVTSGGKIYCYKLSMHNVFKARANFKFSLILTDVKKIEYKILHEISHIYKYGVPVRISLKKNMMFSILITGAYSVDAELFKKLIVISKGEVNDESEIDRQAEITQLSRLKEMLDRKLISKEKYEILYKRLKITISKRQTKLIEERMEDVSLI